MIYAACHNKASTLGSVLECALRHKNEHLCLDCCEYIAGKIEPHYPVPAIPTYVTWDRCFVMGQVTKMHVLWWRKLSDGTWYGVKATSCQT